MSENDCQNSGVCGPMGDASVDRAAAQVDQRNHALGNQIEEAAERMAQLTGALAETRNAHEPDQQDRPLGAAAPQQSDGWLGTVLDSILAGIIVVDPQTRRIVDANATAVRLIGLPKERIVGQVCHQFVCPAEQGRCPVLDLGQQVDRSERVLVKGNGERLPVLKTVARIQWQGRSYLIGSFVDISEWKQTQQHQADLVQKMESANKELIDFAHVVSHDLKAPLRGIKTLAGWIASDYSERLDKQGQEQLSLLLSRISRMEDLINGILQYSRAGCPVEEGQTVDLADLVPTIIDMIAAPTHMAVTIDNPLPQVRCDKTRIGQVFQNLLSNAVKFMDKPQGRIRICCAQDGEFWKFSVADNGPGIEERFFDRIFKLFQTLVPRDELESSGVGLALVKKIVTFYGGKVWVESRIGEGSTFIFTLPKVRIVEPATVGKH